MEYTTLHISADELLREILIAELSEIGFDMFSETEDMLEACALTENYQEDAFLEIAKQYNLQNYRKEYVAKQNWNELWESNFPYLEINNDCIVRAEFHKLDRQYKYEILIQPKMSFGTGHHATTSLMMRSLMTVDCAQKEVLDAGCGTGILGILALKMGAKSVIANDIEDWTVQNALENAEANHVNMTVKLGDVHVVLATHQSFDIILANINLNVILSELPHYVAMLRRPQGKLLLSGFYIDDIPLVEEKLKILGKKIIQSNSLHNWVCLVIE